MKIMISHKRPKGKVNVAEDVISRFIREFRVHACANFFFRFPRLRPGVHGWIYEALHDHDSCLLFCLFCHLRLPLWWPILFVHVIEVLVTLEGGIHRGG